MQNGVPNKIVSLQKLDAVISVPPLNGETNNEICRFISKVLGFRYSDVIFRLIFWKTGKDRGIHNSRKDFVEIKM